MKTAVSQNAAQIIARAEQENSALLSVMGKAQQVQESLLRNILQRNAESEFGRDHLFGSLRGVEDYRAAVPVRVHEDFKPWLEAAIAGQPGVLADEDPFAYFSSSGTTGVEKRIPVTRAYMKESFIPFYFAGLATVLRRSPGALADDNSVLNLWQDPFSPIDRTSGGQPHIGPSQIDYRSLGEDIAVGLGNRAAWSNLPESFADADPLRRTYLRLRIAAEHDIRCVFAINPAIAHALPEQLAQWWPSIVREIHDGTLGGQPFRSPNPERAKRIEALAGWFGTIRPTHLWPNLRSLVVWTSYIGGLYLPGLAQDFGPGVEVVAAPLGSCEGPLTTPIDRHPTAAPLVTPSAFYEFIPADEVIYPDSPTLLAHELEVGGDYHMVLTRPGGIHRCATRDIMRVVEYLGTTPRLEYGGRQGELVAGTSRLREDQVVRAVGRTVTDTGMPIRNLCVRLDDGPVGATIGYEIAVAFRQPGDQRDIDRFEHLLDVHLGTACGSYARARSCGELGGIRLRQVPVAAFFDSWMGRVRAGQRPPRVKDRVFDGGSPVWSVSA
ncbi:MULTISPECIES: GH3 family domain-containing protein [Rhodococcus]|uniref:GH3 family domain-containing protein n=1 Tax=Rhodococcus TaxID=1827 RepID=UPI001C57FB71|nr:GH3 auxin-responsive promoter family protein [Rhodococcus sp. LW-XY12]QXU55590.1 GH3 auxin-responsive promoter family protein [Rhodococcus sp. LW-XY12]